MTRTDGYLTTSRSLKLYLKTLPSAAAMETNAESGARLDLKTLLKDGPLAEVPRDMMRVIVRETLSLVHAARSGSAVYLCTLGQMTI